MRCYESTQIESCGGEFRASIKMALFGNFGLTGRKQGFYKRL